jgi:predicted transcriptional regulator
VRLFKKWFGGRSEPVIAVSGLPRSGTSMMMRMLDVGGLEVVTDGIREPNADNPRGYYEFERVKKLPEGDTAWLEDARGKVVKVIAALLLHLPDTYEYRVFMMRRKMDEILASQRRMLVRRCEDPDTADDREMARLFEKHLAQVYEWMRKQDNVRFLDVDYNVMLSAPEAQLDEIQAFLDRPMDLQAMGAVVDPSLYRQRR